MKLNWLLCDRRRRASGRASFLVAWVWAVLSSAAGTGLGQDGPPSGEKEKSPIVIDADSLSVNQRTETVEAKGNVEVRREEVILKADEVQVNQATQEAEAKGKVSIDHPEGWLKGESVRFNLEQETGEIENGEIFLERNHVSISGRRFQKLAGQVYHIDEGFFTTCLCESGRPSWKLSGEEIDLRLGGEATVKGGTFYVMDYPVFYLPYAVFPVRTERQTGFLFPKFGFSNKEGFQYQQPFFWAISRNSDATIATHIESRARLGLLGEYRHVFSRDAKGEIAVSYFNEAMRKDGEEFSNRNIADRDIPEDRWNVFANHRQSTPAGWLTYSDIAAFSDDVFTRELLHAIDAGQEEEKFLKTSRFSRSRVGFLKNWEETQLRGEVAFYQDFIQEDSSTFHRTPQAIFRGSRFVLGNLPLEFRWRAEGINYMRREGADGLRLDVRPELIFPFRSLPYLFGSFEFAPRETLYYLHRTEDVFERTKGRELFEVRGRVATSLARVFDFAKRDLVQVKHVLEPELLYLFIPATDQRDIPIMDDTDRINRRNLLTFSLHNYLWGKVAQDAAVRPLEEDVEVLDTLGATEVRPLGRLSLALSYDVDKERKGGDSLSDLDLRLLLTPVRYLDLGMDLGLNPGPWQVRQAAGTVTLRDPRPIMRRTLDPDFMSPNRITLSYRFIRRNFLSPLADNAILDPTTLPPERQIDRNPVGAFGVNLSYRLTDHLLFRFNSNYDARDGRFTGNRGILKILSQCECWTVAFLLNRSTNPARTRFEFEFTLLGLGSRGSGFGSQSTAAPLGR